MLSSLSRLWRRATVLVGVAVVLVVASISVATAMTRPMAYPSVAQISAQLQAGANFDHIPDGQIVPGIGVPGQVDFLVPHPRWSECAVVGSSVRVTATTIAHCTFGDRSGSITIGIYGDSNAAMWAPAFDIYGALHHRRIIVLAHMGCTTWPRPWIHGSSSSSTAISEKSCATWRRNALVAMERAHVEYVLPISIDTSGVHDVLSTATLVSSLQSNFSQIRRHGLKPFALDPVPRYTFKTDYLNCLTAHPDSLRQCMIRTTAVGSTRLNRAYASAARALSVPEVATTDLFCSPARCPLFVAWEGRNIQIHRDGQHITAAYAQLIAAALAPRITTAISRAH